MSPSHPASAPSVPVSHSSASHPDSVAQSAAGGSPPLVFSLLALVTLLGILSRHLGWWSPSSNWHILPPRAVVVPVGGLLLGGLALRSLYARMPLRLSPTICGAGLVVYWFSDAIARPYSLFLEPANRGEVLLCGMLGMTLLRNAPQIFWKLLLPGAIALVTFSFLRQSGGAPLQSDDHSVFFFRLELLRSQFPHIPFYAPLWNAGFDARDFFATGALGVYLLFAPLIHAVDLHLAYNIVVIGLLFLLVPLATYGGVRILRVDAKAAPLAAVLALISSLMWFRWGLKYGTLGFCLATALLPLNLILISLLVDNTKEKPRWIYLLTFFSLSFMLSWALIGVTLIPLGVVAAFRIRQLLKDRKLLVLAAALFVVHGPWLTLLWRVSSVGSFLTSGSTANQLALHPSPPPAHREHSVSSGDEMSAHDTVHSRSVEIGTPESGKSLGTQTLQGTANVPHFRHKAGTFNLKKSLNTLDDFLVTLNPLIFFLTLPGILLLPRSQRWAWGLTSSWLVLLGTIAVPLKPQLELDRMLVVLGLISAIPAGLAFAALLSATRNNNFAARIVALPAVGFLLTSPFLASAITLNRSLEQYTFRSPLLSNMAEAIEQYGGEGRTVFAGFYLHELDQGHLAPLALYTSKPLVASSFVHNVWRYTSLIPNEYASRGREGIEEFLDLYNATAVIAREEVWRRYFKNFPERYTEVWYGHPFHLYRRQVNSPSYFVRGNGSLVEQRRDAVRLKVDSEDVLVKFRYFPFLITEGGCTIEPATFPAQLHLVHLTHCTPGAVVTIRAQSPVARLFAK